jgi:hypothetical protein
MAVYEGVPRPELPPLRIRATGLRRPRHTRRLGLGLPPRLLLLLLFIVTHELASPRPAAAARRAASAVAAADVFFQEHVPAGALPLGRLAARGARRAACQAAAEAAEAA